MPESAAPDGDFLQSNGEGNVSQVIGLFVKRAHGLAADPCDRLFLQRGQGIVDDVNALVGSPRQVLLSSAPALSELDLPPGSLGENIVCDRWVEALPSGTLLQIGASAQLRLTFLCEPCAFLERIRPGLMRQSKGKRGMLALVVRDGPVCLGDTLTVIGRPFSPLSEIAKDRFREFVARIPPGKVVTTADLIIALGVTPSYHRVFPILLKKAALDLPVHRIVGTEGRLLTRHLPDQAARLHEDGVAIHDDRVSPDYYWSRAEFHALAS